MGVSNSWLVYFFENSMKIPWMMTGGRPMTSETTIYLELLSLPPNIHHPQKPWHLHGTRILWRVSQVKGGIGL